MALDPEERITSFWIKMAGVYPDLSKMILKLHLSFPLHTGVKLHSPPL